MKRITKKRFSMAEVVGFFALMMLGLAPYADAQTTVPTTFTPDTTAKADEVNANFQALADAIDTIELTQGPEGPAGQTGLTGLTGLDGLQGPNTTNSNSLFIGSDQDADEIDSTLELGTDAFPIMTLLENGNVGIGTTGPVAQLEVMGSIMSSGTITMTFSAGATTFTTSAPITLNVGDYVRPFASFEPRAVTVGGTGTSFTVSRAYSSQTIATTFTVFHPIANLIDDLGTTVLFAQGGSGNVGIGTTAPAFNQKLHVSGGNLQVGEAASPKGITLFDVGDAVPASAHCVRILNDVLNVSPGACP